MNSRILSILAIITSVVALCCTSAYALPSINYQGYLTSPSGAAVNASVPMVFNLYDAATGGNVIHTETQTVTVSNGIFNVELGIATALTAAFNLSYSYWLGVTVGGDAEMTPRRPLMASPLAVYALSAESAEALAASASVDGSQITGAISTATLPTTGLTGTLATAQIADASITAAKLASNGCTGGQVLAYNGSAWTCATPAASTGGTVTSITAGTGLTGGTITATGTVGLANLGVGTAQLADASVTAVKLASNGCSSGQILKYTGLAWACATDDTGVPAGGAVGQVLAGTGAAPAWTSVPTIAGNVVIGATTTQPGPSRLQVVAPTAKTTATSGIRGLSVTSNEATAPFALDVKIFGAPLLANRAVILQSTDWNTLDGGNLLLQPQGGNVGVGLGMFSPASTLTVAGRIESTSGGVKFPDGTTQTTAAAPTVTGLSNSAGNTLTTVDSGGNVGEHTSITLGADGLPVISYYDNTNGDLKVAKCSNPSCTGASTVTTVDSGGDVGAYSSITLGADGLPVISYYDNTNGDLKVAKCSNPACTGASTLTTVDSVGNVGYYTSITLGADGLPVISFYDQTNVHLKVAKCSNPACTGASTLTTVDSRTLVGLFSSITLGADGLPVISSYDYLGDLRVAKCVNPACTGASTLTTVDSASVGQYASNTSITLGADGLPVIGYYGYDNSVLKVAKCSNPACTGASTLTTVDSGGNVGQHTSITLGADGLPVISYRDVTNGDLKVAKCSSATCVPFVRRR